MISCRATFQMLQFFLIGRLCFEPDSGIFLLHERIHCLITAKCCFIHSCDCGGPACCVSHSRCIHVAVTAITCVLFQNWKAAGGSSNYRCVVGVPTTASGWKEYACTTSAQALVETTDKLTTTDDQQKWPNQHSGWISLQKIDFGAEVHGI